MATAQSYQANLPDVHITSPQEANGPAGTGEWLKNFGIYQYSQRYQNALSENERAYNQALLREQRAYDEFVRKREFEREDTTYQRLRKDLEAAGINPLYALQGGLSGSSARTGISSSSQNIHDSSAERVKSKEGSTGIAALLLSVAKIVATFLG